MTGNSKTALTGNSLGADIQPENTVRGKRRFSYWLSTFLFAIWILVIFYDRDFDPSARFLTTAVLPLIAFLWGADTYSHVVRSSQLPQSDRLNASWSQRPSGQGELSGPYSRAVYEYPHRERPEQPACAGGQGRDSGGQRDTYVGYPVAHSWMVDAQSGGNVAHYSTRDLQEK